MLMSSRPQPLKTPKNGKQFHALLVGGYPPERDEMREKLLAEYNIAIVEHWPSATAVARIRERRIGADMDLVIVIAEMFKVCNRDVTDKARASGSALVILSRRKAEWGPALQNAGIPPYKPPAPAPEKPVLKAVPPLPVRTPAVRPPQGFVEVKLVEEPVAPKPAAPVVEVPPAPKPVAATPAPATPDKNDKSWISAPWTPKERPRYIPAPGKGERTWTEAHDSALVDLAASGITNAQEYMDKIEDRFGIYRTPSILQQRIRVFASFCSPAPKPELLRGLDQAASKIQQAKDQFLSEERLKTKAANPEVWTTEYVTTDSAARALCRAARVRELDGLFDRATGLFVYKREDVVALRAAYIKASGDGILDKVIVLGRSALSNDIAERMLEYINTQVGSAGITARDLLQRHRQAYEKAKEALDRLIAENKVVAVPAPSGRGRLIGPVGWNPPAPAKKAGSAPAAPPPAEPKAAAGGVETPSGRIDPVLSADIYRAIREGEITPAQGVEMLKQLRG